MKDWHDQKTRQTRRPRRLEEVNTVEVGFPIAWIVVGVLAGLLVIGLIGLGVVNIVRKQSITPTPPSIPNLAPTQPIAEAAPAEEQVQITPTLPPVVTLEPTPTPTPTETPIPVLPETLEAGVFAKVVGTEGVGVSLRAGPGTNNARLDIALEGDIVLILKGPEADSDQQEFIWWFVRHPNGTEGWAVQRFLEPTLPPDVQ